MAGPPSWKKATSFGIKNPKKSLIAVKSTSCVPVRRGISNFNNPPIRTIINLKMPAKHLRDRSRRTQGRQNQHKDPHGVALPNEIMVLFTIFWGIPEYRERNGFRSLFFVSDKIFVTFAIQNHQRRCNAPIDQSGCSIIPFVKVEALSLAWKTILQF